MLPFASSVTIRTYFHFAALLLIYLSLFLLPLAKNANSLKHCSFCADNNIETTVYVWNSQRHLERSQQENDYWKQLHLHGINRLLFSLDGRQIQKLELIENQRTLIKFLHHAADEGIRVELLLGEPLWILPAYRQDLLVIIDRLSDLPFTGLHLDLEPNQLAEKRHDVKKLRVDLRDTFQAALEISPWPVGLSIHPRYLEFREDGFNLDYSLRKMGLNEIILMIYNSNPGQVAQRALPIVKRFPNITFSIAQSVEGLLPGSESYAKQGRKQFYTQMAKLCRFLIEMNNFAGIAIQSWTDFDRLRP